ncbi:MAG: iron ABC transporter ATP-binding protein [Caulobacter sp. 12-67-6]|nr:MAG: iron ABC transporter ATP-binding protein [Caulobacter sp. 12-67-6]OYX72712.1 MAG: iron ABC transporter ATP-binding protein [Caulobacter sp. 32-67-35]OYX92324.1 MAG: iron ABC transporter ATP-binding protein [Caulobacter sp. 35-67-4]
MTAAWTLSGLKAQQGDKQVLDAASLVVSPGEVVGVVGPNGAGKTSLLRAGLGLLPRTAGEVWLGDRRLETLTVQARAARVGYLPQDRRLAWNLPAEQVASLGAVDLPEADALAVARERLARVGAGDLATRRVLEMSGGERARVLLARLLTTRAPLLVADEPIAGLDPDAQLLTLDLLRKEAESGAGVVVTLHDLSLAARCCDRLLVIEGGRIVSEGAPIAALSPEVLARVFKLDGALVETPAGPVLAARRL